MREQDRLRHVYDGSTDDGDRPARRTLERASAAFSTRWWFPSGRRSRSGSSSDDQHQEPLDRVVHDLTTNLSLL
jgi:hypothetical protein